MSNQISAIAVRPFLLALLSSAALLISVNDASAQSEGFSIFDAPAEEVIEKAVETVAAVSPQEAFTNPTAKLPKSQFGSYADPTGLRTPTMEGAKAIGTYAHQSKSLGQSLPHITTNGGLKPFAANSLRPNQDSPSETANATASAAATPIRIDDFPPSARRLSAAPADAATSQNPLDAPKVAQVAFQDGGGFSSRASQGTTPPNRFQARTRQPTAKSNRFRFGNSTPSSTPGQATLAPENAAQSSHQPTPYHSTPRTSQPQADQRSSAQTATTPFRQPRSSNGNRLGAPSISGQSSAHTKQPRSGLAGFASSTKQATSRSQIQNSKQPTRTPRTATQPRPNERQASVQGTPSSAKQLLNAWVTTDSQEELPGKRMKFYEFLSQPINGSKKAAINQYWITFADLARYRMAIEQTQWLKSISKPRQQSEQAILAAAQQAAQNRVLHSEIQLAKSQSLLSDYLPNLRQNGKLVAVLPSNIPWVGKLNTKFEEYQRRGMVPARFGTIDDYLPKARTLIANEAEAVIASDKAANQTRSAMQSGQTAVANVLEAARMKQQNEEEFLSAVLGYNRAITDYVLSVRQDIYQPKRLATVLIGRKSIEPTPATATKPTARSGGTSDFSQIERSSQIEGPSEDRDALSTNSNPRARQQGTRVASSQSIQYGPTADSAKAANFDPTKLEEERPMQQIKPTSNSESYAGSNQSNPSRRTASNPVAQRTRQPIASQPRRIQPASSSGGTPRTGFGGQGAANSAPSIPSAPTSTFNGASNSAPRVGTFPSTPSAISGGGGTFGGAGGTTPSAPATASGIGTPGFSTRR